MHTCCLLLAATDEPILLPSPMPLSGGCLQVKRNQDKTMARSANSDSLKDDLDVVVDNISTVSIETRDAEGEKASTDPVGSVRLTPAQYFSRSRKHQMQVMDVLAFEKIKSGAENGVEKKSQSVESLVKRFSKVMDLATKKSVFPMAESSGKKDASESGGVVLSRGPIFARMNRNLANMPYALPQHSSFENDKYYSPYPMSHASRCETPYLNISPSPQQLSKQFYMGTTTYPEPFYSRSISDAPVCYETFVSPFADSQVNTYDSTEINAIYDHLNSTQTINEATNNGTFNANDTMSACCWVRRLSDGSEADSSFSDLKLSPRRSVHAEGKFSLNQCSRSESDPEALQYQWVDVDQKSELPEGLCDFILKYSRKYQNNAAFHVRIKEKAEQPKVPSEQNFFDDQDSPLSGKSVGDSSPAAPVNTQTASICTIAKDNGAEGVGGCPVAADEKSDAVHSAGKASVDRCNSSDAARTKLRNLIEPEALEMAWAYGMKCELTRPGLLFKTDKDGDSLLHIAVWQENMPLIYAFTEIMLKAKDQQYKPFDLPNKMNETPLFLAVIKKLTIVVEYFVECGANVTVGSKNFNGDTPLHHAAATGNDVIFQLLSQAVADTAIPKNDLGMTPLHSAVKAHGTVHGQSEEEVNNLKLIGSMLKRNYNPVELDNDGQTIFDYCIKKMDSGLLEFIVDNYNGTLEMLMKATVLQNFLPLDVVNFPEFDSFNALSPCGGLQPMKEELLGMLQASMTNKVHHLTAPTSYPR